MRTRIANELAPPELDLESTDPEARADRISQTLSRLTHMAGVVSVPRRNRAVLRRIEFYPLDDAGGRVLVVLVVNGHEVQNRVIRPPRPYAATELADLSALLNEHFAGIDLLGLRDRLVAEATRLKQDIDRMLRAALLLAEQALDSGFAPAGMGPEALVYSGSANLLEGDGSPPDVERLRSLFAALDRQREVLGLFEHCLAAEGGAHLHRRQFRLPHARRLQPRLRPLFHRRPPGRGAGRDRTEPDALFAHHSTGRRGGQGFRAGGCKIARWPKYPLVRPSPRT